MTLTVDAAEVIELTKRLIRVDSVSGREAAVAEVVADYLRSNGIEARLVEAAPGRPNVYAGIGRAEEPSILFCGHLDTVPLGEGWSHDPLGAEEIDGRIYGRGACDMKAGIAGMLTAMVAAARKFPDPLRSIAFAGVVDEEVSSIGIKSALKSGLRARYAVIGEPTELQTICAAKGNSYFKVTVKGRAAHAGSPALGVNAICAAANIIIAIERHDAVIGTRTHPLLGRPHITVTLIEGGSGASAVPDRCVLTLDRRLLPSETAETALDELRAFLESECNIAAEYTTSLEMELPAMELAASHAAVNKVQDASRSSGVVPQAVGGWSAACDGGHCCRAGIPTVLFGPGSIVREAHRPNESVPVDEIVLAANTYAVLAERALTGHGES
jgi:acetylornithine deacetylase/succinyl-diaminopimelate desuccinylase family protein